MGNAACHSAQADRFLRRAARALNAARPPPSPSLHRTPPHPLAATEHPRRVSFQAVPYGIPTPAGPPNHLKRNVAIGEIPPLPISAMWYNAAANSATPHIR